MCTPRPRTFLLATIVALAALAPTGRSDDPAPVQQLRASDETRREAFGSAVSIDGRHAVIGTPSTGEPRVRRSGSVYAFVRAGSRWVEAQKITASDAEDRDLFGSSVSLCGDTLLVGSPKDDDLGNNSGAAYVYRYDGSRWTEEQKLTAPDGGATHQFGWSVALDGEVAVINSDVNYYPAPSGSAYVYRRGEAGWSLEQKIESPAGDSFASWVAISGPWILISAPEIAHCYHFDGRAWEHYQGLRGPDATPEENFGGPVALQGELAVVGATSWDNPGAAYIFRRTPQGWTQEQKIYASDGSYWSQFGRSLAIDDDLVLVGAQRWAGDTLGAFTGWAYVFRRHGNRWIEEQRLPASDDSLGTIPPVAASEGTAVVGAPWDSQSRVVAGAARIYSVSPCRFGTVNGGAGRITRLLRVNGGFGDGYSRVDVPTWSPLTVSMDAPASAPANAKFAVYAWRGKPSDSSLTPMPHQIGVMCKPAPLTGGRPAPIAIWNNIGHPKRLGKATHSSVPAPSTLLYLPRGLRRPATLTLQGLVEDPASAANRPASVTNVVVLRVGSPTTR